jgi:hypothetical protein
MIPANVRLVESAAEELRDLRRLDPAIFKDVVEALRELGLSGPPPNTRRIPLSLPARAGTVDYLLFGFDLGSVRVLFEGERIVTRSAEGWNLTRSLPRASACCVYTIWAIVSQE